MNFILVHPARLAPPTGLVPGPPRARLVPWAPTPAGASRRAPALLPPGAGVPWEVPSPPRAMFSVRSAWGVPRAMFSVKSAWGGWAPWCLGAREPPRNLFVFCEPRGPHRSHCGREFLLPVSVGSVRSSRVELVAAGVKLRWGREPEGHGASGGREN